MEDFYKQRCQDKRIEQEDSGIFYLNGEINEVSMEYIYSSILSSINNRNIDEITLYIHSNGGEVLGLFPIIDLIELSPKPIITKVLGNAYSCAAVLLTCGHDGKRFAHKNSDILFHQVNGRVEATRTGVKEYLDSMDIIQHRIQGILERKTKLTTKQIDRINKSEIDFRMSAQEALEYGVIGHIIDKDTL